MKRKGWFWFLFLLVVLLSIAFCTKTTQAQERPRRVLSFAGKPGEIGEVCDKRRYPDSYLIQEALEFWYCPPDTEVWTQLTIQSPAVPAAHASDHEGATDSVRDFAGAVTVTDTSAPQQEWLYDGSNKCTLSVSSGGVGTIACTPGDMTIDGGAAACGSIEEIQYATLGGGALDCSTAFIYDESEYELVMFNATADRELSIFSDDSPAAVPANTMMILAQDTDVNEAIDELIIASDNGIVYQSCCTGGSECRWAADGCPAAGDDRITMVAGEFYVCDQTGVCDVFAPGGAMTTEAAAGVTTLTIDNDTTKTTGDLFSLEDSGTETWTVDKDGGIVYPTGGSATQVVYEHTQTAYANPTMIEKFIRSTGTYQQYAMGGYTYDGKSIGFNNILGNITDRNATQTIYGTISAQPSAAGNTNAGIMVGYLDFQIATAGADAIWISDGAAGGSIIGKVTSDGTDVCYEWWDGAGAQSAALCDTAADQVTLEDADMNLETGFDYNVNGAEIESYWSLPFFLQSNDANVDQEILGGFNEVTTGDAINSGASVTLTDFGITKIYVVLNTCTDSAGSITVTGTSVNRDTGAETTSDTDTLTISGTTTDSSSTDSNGNTVHDITDGYITSKWFRGDDGETDIVLSTSDIDCTDIDVYGVSFYQFGDRDGITVNEFNMMTFFTVTAAYIDSYFYSVKPTTGDKCDINNEAELHITAADSSANELYRLRKGNLGVSIDGSSEGVFMDFHPISTAARVINTTIFLSGTSEITP
jgi:hypothetical protein